MLLGDFNAHVIRQVGVGISANFVQFFACFDYRESSISTDLFWEKWELHCSKTALNEDFFIMQNKKSLLCHFFENWHFCFKKLHHIEDFGQIM